MNKKPLRQKPDRQLLSRLQAWILQNLQALISSLGQLWRKPLGSVLTAAVIGISLTLPAGFYVLLNNAEQLTERWDGSVKLTVFLRQDVSDDAAGTLMKTLEKDAAIEQIRFRSSDEAMQEYKRLSGFSNALDMLDENPLPSMFLITPAEQELQQNDASGLIERLNSLQEVDMAMLDRQWLNRLELMLVTIKRGVYIISVLLATAVLLIVGNTIRLGILNNRQEIEITKLFGGTNGFIQRPFLYTGLWYGVFGSLIAWLLITCSLLMLEQPIAELALSYGSNFELDGLGVLESLILVLCGGFLGLFGSFLSVAQHIRTIEPA